MFVSPINRTDRQLPDQIQDLYDGVGMLVNALNEERDTRATRTVYAGSAASGTVAVDDALRGGHIFLAVIGGVPTLAVKYGQSIAARGGNKDTTVSLTATVNGETMTYSASGTLEALILIL